MELLDFNSRDNFDLRIAPAYRIPERQQEKLKSDCMQVVSAAQRSVLDLCKLGYHLREIREDGTWRYVYNEKSGTVFQYQKFTEFTSYAFGISPTMAENCMSISQFTHVDEKGEIVFFNEKYKAYKMSQLVEMSSMQPWQRAEITPNMTVSDIRLCKTYINKGTYTLDRSACAGVGFNLLESAKKWDEKSKAPAPKNPSVLPGQISIEDDGLFDDVNADAVIKNPTSDFAEESAKYFDEQRTEPGDFREIEEPIMIPAPDSFYDDAEPKEGEVWQAGGIDTDDYDEEDEAYEDMQADMETIEDDAEKSVENPTSDLAVVSEEKPGPDFNTRQGIRDFLNDYRKWPQYWQLSSVAKIYGYTFRNGMSVFALENKATLDIDSEEYTTNTRFLFRKSKIVYDKTVEVSKAILWPYLRDHKDELLGVAK